MNSEQLTKFWFQKWEEGDFRHLPISDDFKHTSPYGTIKGKGAYISLVEANMEQFLGHRFEISDAIYAEDRACVRYTAIQGEFRLEVSEWHYFKGNHIEEIVAYYNIEGEGRLTETGELK